MWRYHPGSRPRYECLTKGARQRTGQARRVVRPAISRSALEHDGRRMSKLECLATLRAFFEGRRGTLLPRTWLLPPQLGPARASA